MYSENLSTVSRRERENKKGDASLCRQSEAIFPRRAALAASAGHLDGAPPRRVGRGSDAVKTERKAIASGFMIRWGRSTRAASAGAPSPAGAVLQGDQPPDSASMSSANEADIGGAPASASIRFKT